MKKYLFIAEKTSSMKVFREVYEKNKSEINKNVGFIDFIAVSGHICRYLEPKEYPKWKEYKWKELPLPMIPNPFKITKMDGNAKKIYDRIKDTLDKDNYDGIIVGTDSDSEGNGIYYLICECMGLRKYETLRFFEEDLTEKNVLKSFLTMTDFWKNDRDVNMTNAFLLRSQSDQKIGMNATVAASVRFGELYKIGRVKANVIKIVRDNSVAIDDFKPHSDFLVKSFYKDSDYEFTGILSDDDDKPISFETTENAKDMLDNINFTDKATVISIDRKKQKIQAPQLFKLSTLQDEAGTEFSYNPQKIQDLVESLYLKKLVSYPRTDSIYISSEEADLFVSQLNFIKNIPEFNSFVDKITSDDIERVKNNKKVVNDVERKKISHSALIPLVPEGDIDLSSLTDDELNIYKTICKRFLSEFLPEKIEEKTVLIADINGYRFKSNGSMTLEDGWSALYDKKEKAEIIPNFINKDDVLAIDKLDIHEKKSSPPKRLTTATLVKAMENIASFIEDKELKAVMKDAKGLGMPSTRAVIINQVIDTGYMTKKGKNEALYITEMGKRYIDALSGLSIIDPAQAAKWENMFSGVREGVLDFKTCEEDINSYITDFVKEIEKKEAKKIHNSNELNLFCPYCKKPLLKTKFGFGCSGYKEGCKFSLSSYDGKVKESDLSDLILKGKTRKIKNICYSKKNDKSYDASIVLNPIGSDYVTKFEF